MKAALLCLLSNSTVKSTLINQAAQLHFLSNHLIEEANAQLHDIKYLQSKQRHITF